MNTVEHLLVCLAEECAEVQQATTKALRFGLEDGYPGGKTTNAQDIAKEFIEAAAIIEMLIGLEAISPHYEGDEDVVNNKKERVEKYMGIAKKLGTLND